MAALIASFLMNGTRKSLLAISLACWFFAPILTLISAPRPRYGGTLRVKLQASVRSLDPAEVALRRSERATQAKLLSLVFEPLVRLDHSGIPRPALASSWTHRADQKVWSFQLRRGIQFHDGLLLTPASVVSALKTAQAELQISASSENVSFQSERPVPDLPQRLARYSVFKRSADGKVLGTGPFRVTEWTPGRTARLVAHEHWRGRPFLDAVEVEMARTLRDQFSDLELGRADFVEISPSRLRNAAQRGYPIWSAAPTELWALVFRQEGLPVGNARFREALALSIDRSSMHSVLLQKQGEPAGALLPQWLSGYSFLFPTGHNLERARVLRARIASNAQTIGLSYASLDPLERAVAERIAVNAREAGLLLKPAGPGPSAQAPASAGGFDLKLVRVSLSAWYAAEALEELAAALGLAMPFPPVDLAAPEALYAAEQKLLEGYQVIPLFHLPVIYALHPRVKNASGQSFSNMPSLPWEALPLEDLWLMEEKALSR